MDTFFSRSKDITAFLTDVTHRDDKKASSLREAETQLHEIIAKTLSEGPQTIETQTDTQVVLLSHEEYRRLQSPKPRFVEFMRQSLWLGAELNIQRDTSPARDIDL